MKVSDILRTKGNTLYTIAPLTPLAEAVKTMAEHDLGSMLVMDHGDLVGILTFREVILALNNNGGATTTTFAALEAVIEAKRFAPTTVRRIA